MASSHTHAVPDAAAAWQIVAWYSARWIIEQLFRLLKKQGLRLEDSQVETAERLLKPARSPRRRRSSPYRCCKREAGTVPNPRRWP
jgi:hypothetical protein